MTAQDSIAGQLLVGAQRRQFVNEPGDIVAEALEGLEGAYPRLIRWNREPSFVIRAEPAPAGRVAVVSGGGSGHEPLHVGMVGEGMLDAAVPGAVFASPTAGQILAATQAAARDAGVVHVVKNYTGDVLNFAIAAEVASDDGIEVRQVLVDDDLATTSTTGDGPGRRGTAATVIVEKIVGAAAAAGADLDRVAALGRRVATTSRSMAVALAAGAHPGRAYPSFDLPSDEVEFGVGIHGERGVGRRAFATADELADQLVRPLVADLSIGRGDRVIAITNGLGATTGLELAVVHRRVTLILEAAGITIERALVGPYVTSLDMAGCSVTLTRADDELLALWDAPVRTIALSW
ncbi:dihydroxyacetone kinase subunit DhaK [Frankia sp. CNm7]|uniref:Dihydroxyacetone kinase subunit DhaK n=1 Tax=Frankia nepalensis TaxID=1836974 RepID=A0A937RD78_9ACTN|nr:dihydroxyacetone kinase subunit DhaK [Frankia nepalensis]MBL7514542.1 dihydroxyacetone kinase subunit DhaK [Frankia nepalensis]MBL7522221.1 dihydroxyacetone kinase subunit DhaK [Frankia nepalensis]MBL7626845.1 dihydroxyacetone kinase subunit DhaK [Frankia nepalensis]